MSERDGEENYTIFLHHVSEFKQYTIALAVSEQISLIEHYYKFHNTYVLAGKTFLLFWSSM